MPSMFLQTYSQEHIKEEEEYFTWRLTSKWKLQIWKYKDFS